MSAPDAFLPQAATGCATTIRMMDPIVREAVTKEAIEKALYVRWLGYRKYDSFCCSNGDAFDGSSNSTLLLAEDVNGVALGTMRILDGRSGPIELDSYVDVAECLPVATRSVAEATRFSVPNGPQSKRVKLLLWKAFLAICQSRGIDYMLVSMRPAASRDYSRLLFSPCGEAGSYTHSSLGDLAHHAWYLHIPTAEVRYRAVGHPLTSFFFDEAAPDVTLP